MVYKIPELNKNGQPICEICGVGHDRVLTHANRKHGITANEYKVRYGYYKRRGIQSATLLQKTKENALKNYDRVIMENLIIKGRTTRFEKGNTATDRELVSQIARRTMNSYWESRRQTQDDLIASIIKKLANKSRNSNPY